MAGPTHQPETGIEAILQQYWGFRTFRPMQAEIIRAVLAGRDCLALMPTGGGKSLCYQVPALARPGLCLVVSPLVALIRDQVEALRKKGITAFGIYTGMNRGELLNTLKLAGNSNCKFLYVSPERLETALFKEYLPGLGVSLIAVDEAHCISQWGYDFRPAYLRIAALREELPAIPVLALTASATPDVQADICERLGFPEPLIFRQSFARPQLSFSVFETPDPFTKMVSVLTHVPGSSLVYCRSRRKTEEIAGRLQKAGFNAHFYHAGLPPAERQQRQQAWQQNQSPVMVCTNAFGMGIDKADVRAVIHLDLPDSLEFYYQEAGRAGRNGEKAYAVLLHTPNGAAELRSQEKNRFPPLDTIREIYQALASYLQIPVGSGQGIYHSLPLEDFLSKFPFPPLVVTNTLQLLEQEGWLSFQEQSFSPARARVLAGRQRLEQFEKEQPALAPLLDQLLRNYEGIMDRLVPIFEKQLAYRSHVDAGLIREQLLQLQRQAIIEYQPALEGPQLCLLEPRVKSTDLVIDPQVYEQRRRRWLDRLENFLAYLQEKTGCRSQWIGRYFGDESLPPCGICDNCLHGRQNNPVK